MKSIEKILVGLIVAFLFIFATAAGVGIYSIKEYNERVLLQYEKRAEIEMLINGNTEVSPDVHKKPDVTEEPEVKVEAPDVETKDQGVSLVLKGVRIKGKVTENNEVTIEQGGSKGQIAKENPSKPNSLVLKGVRIKGKVSENNEITIKQGGSKGQIAKENPSKPKNKTNTETKPKVKQDVTSLGQAEIDRMPFYLKRGMAFFRKATPQEIKSSGLNSNAIAYVQNLGIHWISEEVVKEDWYYLYHEMGHVWINMNPHYITNELRAAFNEEWAGTGHYGATNINEAVAETVSYIFTKRKRLPNSPKFQSIIERALKDSQSKYGN